MELSANMEILALLLTFGVHVLGAGVLIWALIDHEDEDAGTWRDWWPKERPDDGPVEPSPGPSSDGVERPLLPDTAASPVRLREPGRISERRPAPARRPAHPAEPAPARERDPV